MRRGWTTPPYLQPGKAGGQSGAWEPLGVVPQGQPGRRLGSEGLQPWMLRAHSGDPSRIATHSHTHGQRGDNVSPLSQQGRFPCSPQALHTQAPDRRLSLRPGFSRFSWAPAVPPKGVTPHCPAPSQAAVLLAITPPPQRHLIRSPHTLGPQPGCLMPFKTHPHLPSAHPPLPVAARLHWPPLNTAGSPGDTPASQLIPLQPHL